MSPEELDELLELEELLELLELEDEELEELLELLELDDEELLELEEELEELELDDEPVLPNTLACTAVSAMPSAPLIRRSPHTVRFDGLNPLTISNSRQQLPLPDQDQPR